MNHKTVDVIIPVYKPGKEWEKQIYLLEKQTYPVRFIRVMNTGKENWDPLYENRSSKMQVTHVTEKEFDHGGTRDQAARMSDADYLLFMTQDAIPEGTDLVEKLVNAMEQEEDIRVAYARQLPAEGCGLAEQYTRKFNYPPVNCVKRKKDLPKLGIKTYFCSNVCAMYDRKTYLELGGFVKKTIFNEDMIFASKLIEAHKAIYYQAEAKVWHWHDYTGMEQFHRNFDLGVSQAEHPEVFAEVPSEGEGMKLVRQSAGYAWSLRRPDLLVSLFLQSGFKYMGYFLGKHYQKLPKSIILRCTMNREYWTFQG